MFGSAVLEVAIGLIFIYTVLSVVSSMIQERIAQIFDWRSKLLAEGIERLLLDPDVRKSFYAHPLIKSLERSDKRGKTAHPAYIPCQTFTTVVWDVVNTMVGQAAAKGPDGSGKTGATTTTAGAASSNPVREAYQQVWDTVEELPEGEFRTTITAFLRTSGKRVDTFKENVEDWFDNSMDRVSSWYKQRAHLVVLFIAIALTVAGNVDSIRIADALWSEPATRESLVALAEIYGTEEGEAKLNQGEALADVQQQLAGLDLPLGWSEGFPKSKNAILSKIIGLLFTTFAVSLGAPFWFDVLKNAVRLSGTVRGITRGQAPPAPPSAETK